MKRVIDKINKLKKYDLFYYSLILLYGLLFISIIVNRSGYIFGYDGDWLSQHSTFPDIFRNLFYTTGRIAPNLLFQLGAGQNIFNYSYHGLYSPIYLLGYLLPFIKMGDYVVGSSIVIYLLSGILLFKFLKLNNINNWISLILSLVLLTMVPVSHHLYHHVMFVSYIPFLILGCMASDYYVKTNKSSFLILMCFFIIMTNYYFSIPCLVVIFIYTIYRAIDLGKIQIRNMFSYGVRLFIKIMISILMASLLLLPTLYTIISEGGRGEIYLSNLLLELLVPKFDELFYSRYSAGISFVFLLICIIILYYRKKYKKSDLFLIVNVLIFTISPIFLFLFNGGLYFDGKVLIPFSVLYLLIVAIFFEKSILKDMTFKKILLLSLGLAGIVFLSGFHSFYFYFIDVLVTILFFFYAFQLNDKRFLIVALISVIVINSGFNSISDFKMTIEHYNDVYDKDSISLINNINHEDKGFYRTANISDEIEVVNHLYNDNYYSITNYSSIFNSKYRDVYFNDFNNNTSIYIGFQHVGVKNPLFYNFMGVRYYVGEEAMASYKEIDSIGDKKLYYSDLALPIVYASDNLISYEDYKKLNYPYNVDANVNNSIVNDGNKNYVSNISEYKSSTIEDSYQLTLYYNATYYYFLSNKIRKNQVLLISFDMNHNACIKDIEQEITINGVKNLISCEDYVYHNGNNNFQYVISSDEEITKLTVNVGMGKYDISNVKMYVMDYDVSSNYNELQNVDIDKKNSKISGNININNDSYIITSIPYDKGFGAFIDGNKVKTEIVNNAFLGFKIGAGKHDIVIKYNSPWYREGIIVTIIGLILFVFNFIFELKTNNKKSNA